MTDSARTVLERWREVAAGVLLAAAVAASPAIAPAPAGAGVASRSTVLMQGRLVDARGRPLAGHVQLMLVPPGRVTAGEHVFMPFVASASVGPDGAFELAVDPRAPSVRAAEAAGRGYVNLVFQAEAGGYTATRAFSASSVGDVWAPAVVPRTVVLARGVAGDLPAVAPPSPAGGARVWAGGTPIPAGCSGTILNVEVNWAKIGELHKWDDTTADFSYGSTADSDMGVGVSLSGVDGSWSVDGTFHVSTSSGASIGITPTASRWGYQLLSRFSYAKSYEQPKYLCNHGVCVPVCYAQYWAYVTTWEGSLLVGTNVGQFDGQCLSKPTTWNFYPPSSRFATTTERAYTYKGGISIFGFGFTTQSGFSISVSESWRFGTKYTRYWLCGNNAVPNSSGIVYAGPDQTLQGPP